MTTLFVTGTGTGVGKTVATALLGLYLADQGRVCVYKPIQTGSNEDDDADWVALATAGRVETRCRYRFEIPAAPYVSDYWANHYRQTIAPERLAEDLADLQARFDWVLVEGAGGVRVPIAPGLEFRDWMRSLGLPALVVARPDLGTINHTLLSVESLLMAGVSVPGVLVCGMPAHPSVAEVSLADVLAAHLPVPYLGALPRVAALSSARPEALAEAWQAGLADVARPVFARLLSRLG